MPAESPPNGTIVASGSPDSLDGRSKPVRGVVYCARTAVPARDRGPCGGRYGGPMPTEIEIAPVTAARVRALLPLIAAYQRFYEVEEIDEERNRAFFRRFLAPSDGRHCCSAPGAAASCVGYACLYWHFSSTQAVETVLMNDLFVGEAARGEGVGRALIEASAAVARERGAAQPRVVDRPRQPHRPAPLRLHRRRALRMDRVRARPLMRRLRRRDVEASTRRQTRRPRGRAALRRLHPRGGRAAGHRPRHRGRDRGRAAART